MTLCPTRSSKGGPPYIHVTAHPTAVWLWANWYRVITPQQKIARFTIKVGITLNTCVIPTAAYFRYAVGRG